MSKSLRILFIGHSGYGYPHTRVRCYHFAEQLARRGWNTDVLSFHDHLAPEVTEEDMYAKLRDRDKTWLVLHGLQKLIRERDTVFYIQKIHFHTAAPFLMARLGVNRYILDYDDYDVPLSNLWHRGRWNRLFFGSHDWEKITEMVAARSVGCVASSHALVNYLLKQNKNVWHVPTGVDSDVFYPVKNGQKRTKTLLYWNGIVWGEAILENLVFILEVFREAYASNSSLRLRIQGAGSVWVQLKAIVDKGYRTLPVELLDWVSPDAMPALLREADIGLLPLVQRNEWTQAKSPTKLYEYMASGLAVVASANGEATHVIRHGKSGWLAQDKASFRQGILTLANDVARRQEMGVAARQRVLDKYSLPRLTDTLEAALTRVLLRR